MQHFFVFIFWKYDQGQREVSKHYRIMKHSSEMNDSEVNSVARKRTDEKYVFFVEKS